MGGAGDPREGVVRDPKIIFYQMTNSISNCNAAPELRVRAMDSDTEILRRSSK